MAVNPKDNAVIQTIEIHNGKSTRCEMAELKLKVQRKQQEELREQGRETVTETEMTKQGNEQ